MRQLLSLLAPSLLLLSCGAQEPPLIPSWDLDVYPILRGSCAHCHGATAMGNMGTPITRYDICNAAPINMAFMADGISIAGPGASTAAASFATFTDPEGNPALRMPPPPASPLTEYELTVLGRWANPLVGKANCNKSVPNRKPTAKLITAAALVPGTNRVGVTVEVSDPDGDQVFGYVRMGNAPLRVVTGAGRARYEFDGVRVTDAIVIKLHDGWDQGP
jgi:hypothetical protein